MNTNTIIQMRPLTPGGDLVYVQTPRQDGVLEVQAEASWGLASQEEALPDAGNAVSVQADGMDQNDGSAAVAASKMTAPIQNPVSASKAATTPKISLCEIFFSAFCSLVTAGSGVSMTLLALNQLPRNDGSDKPEPGEFGVSVTLAVGFFTTAVAATGTAIACGVRYCRERDSQVEAQASV